MISKKAAPRKERDEEERIPLDRAADLGLLNSKAFNAVQTTSVRMAFFSLRRRFGGRQQVKSALGHDPAVCQIKILR